MSDSKKEYMRRVNEIEQLIIDLANDLKKECGYAWFSIKIPHSLDIHNKLGIITTSIKIGANQ